MKQGESCVRPCPVSKLILGKNEVCLPEQLQYQLICGVCLGNRSHAGLHQDSVFGKV
jgi:hypothetical protein